MKWPTPLPHIYFKYTFTWLKQKLFVTVLNMSFLVSDFLMTETGQWEKLDNIEPSVNCPRVATGNTLGQEHGGFLEDRKDKSRRKGGKKDIRFSQESWKSTHLVILFKPRLWRRNFSSAWQVRERVWWRVPEVKSWEAICSRSLWGCREVVSIWHVSQEISDWESAGSAWDWDLLEINKPGCRRASNDNGCHLLSS